MPTDAPAPPRDEVPDLDTDVRLSPEARDLAILRTLRELREASRETWLGYAQEIGRSTLPLVGIRVDVLLVLGLAAAAGLLGGPEVLPRLLGATTIAAPTLPPLPVPP